MIPDLINPRLLKEGSHILAHPYAVICNCSLSLGYFPSSWKKANVTPIFKKDDKSQPSKYRPIFLLSIVGKAMERRIHKYLYNYITVNDILTPLKSGFIPFQEHMETSRLINYYILTILFVRLLIRARK